MNYTISLREMDEYSEYDAERISSEQRDVSL
jgi:hypothetical protein